MDMRRSGAIEAIAGAVGPSALPGEDGHTIGESRELQETYSPAQVAIVQMPNEARVVGRRRMRKGE
jgi:hypothetical protein